MSPKILAKGTQWSNPSSNPDILAIQKDSAYG